MVPSPHAQPQQRGWKGCCRRNRGSGSNIAAPHSRGSYNSPACRPLAALPTGNAPGGGSSPGVLGVLDRAPTSSPTAAPGVAASPASTSAAASPAAAPLPDRTVGYLSLSLVPILWGTYNPCIRYLYAEADPLDPASLTAVRTLLSAGALLLPALVGYLVRKGREAWRRKQEKRLSDSSSGAAAAAAAAAADPTQHEPLGAALAAASDGAADGVASAAAADDVGGGVGGDSSGAVRRSLFAQPLNGARLGPVLTRTFDSVVLGGLELGLLNFLGTALQVEGLHSTSATRAGFLAEVTAVLTPFVSYLAGYDIPRQMWLAVAVGLVGSTMVAYDTSQPHHDPTPTAASPAPAPAPSAEASAAAAPLPSVTETLAPAAAPAASSAADLTAGPSGDVHPDSSTAAATLDGSPLAAATSTSLGSGRGGGLDGVIRTAADAEPAAVLATAAMPQGPEVSATLPSQLAADPQAGSAALEAVADAAAVSVSSAAGDVAIGVSATVLAADPEAALLAAVVAAVGGTTPVPADAAAAALQNTAAEAATSASAAIAGGVAAAPAATHIFSAASAAADAVVASAGLPAVTASAAAASSALEAAGPSASDAASGVVAEAAVAAAAASVATPLAITGGEAYLLLACLFYSICTVRMGIYAPRMDTVSLAAMKKVGLSSMSVMWMAASNLQHGAAPGSMLSFPDLSSRTPVSIAVLMYSGLGPGALATFLQVTGLSTVPATTAQVIYSITPLITAFFAYLILGGETTGPVAWAGGSLIIVAALMAADAQQKQQREQQKQRLEQQQRQ